MTTFSEHRDQFGEELDQIDNALTHALSELNALIASRRGWIDGRGAAAVEDAQAHTLAGLRGLRRAVQLLGATPPKPVAGPEPKATPLAELLAEQRGELVHTLTLVAELPGIDRSYIRDGSEAVSAALLHFERHARVHQPRKPRAHA